MFGLNSFLSAGLHWVAEVPTRSSGTTFLKIPFINFEPTIRAKPIPMPFRLNSSSITQMQLLYSKFGTSGELNTGFRDGEFNILLRSINTIH